MDHYTLRYDGSGGYIGQTPVMEQAIHAAEGYAKSSGLSVLVTNNWNGRVHENVYHPDGSVTHLWDGER